VVEGLVEDNGTEFSANEGDVRGNTAGDDVLREGVDVGTGKRERIEAVDTGVLVAGLAAAFLFGLVTFFYRHEVIVGARGERRQGGNDAGEGVGSGLQPDPTNTNF